MRDWGIPLQNTAMEITYSLEAQTSHYMCVKRTTDDDYQFITVRGRNCRRSEGNSRQDAAVSRKRAANIFDHLMSDEEDVDSDGSTDDDDEPPHDSRRRKRHTKKNPPRIHRKRKQDEDISSRKKQHDDSTDQRKSGEVIELSRQIENRPQSSKKKRLHEEDPATNKRHAEADNTNPDRPTHSYQLRPRGRVSNTDITGNQTTSNITTPSTRYHLRSTDSHITPSTRYRLRSTDVHPPPHAQPTGVVRGRPP